MKIRDARNSDRAALCALHVANWQDSYRDDFPPGFLDNNLPGMLQRHWTTRDLSGPKLILLAEDTTLCGFIRIDFPEDGPYCDGLHVARSVRSSGIGTRLMHAAALRLLSAGHTTLSLDAATSNTRTRAFYRRLGGVEGADYDDTLFGHTLRSVPFHWTDLTTLRDRAAPA